MSVFAPLRRACVASLVVLASACATTPPEGEPEPPRHFSEVDTPVPAAIRISVTQPVAQFQLQNVNYKGSGPAAAEWGLAGLGFLVASALAEQNVNAQRESAAAQADRMLRASVSDSGIERKLAEEVRSALERSDWIEPVRFEQMEAPEPVVSFDTRDAALIKIAADQVFSYDGSALFVTAKVEYFERGTVTPSYSRFFIFVDGDYTVRPAPQKVRAANRKTPHTRRGTASGQISTSRSLSSRAAAWSADGGRRYIQSVDEAVAALSELIGFALGTSEASQAGVLPAETRRVWFPQLHSSSRRKVDVRILREEDGRFLGQIINGHWLSAPTASYLN